MKIVRRGDAVALHRALNRASNEQPTWRGDADAAAHPGFHTEIYRRRVGVSDAALAAAVETVMTWGVQTGAGLEVRATDLRVTVGTTVIVGLPAGPALILAPCRVTEVFSGPDRWGFRYVTLPGHPENGFEEFYVERAADGAVWFVVRPVSRPGGFATTIAGPLARLIQQRAGRRYLRAVESGDATA